LSSAIFKILFHFHKMTFFLPIIIPETKRVLLLENVKILRFFFTYFDLIYAFLKLVNHALTV